MGEKGQNQAARLLAAATASSPVSSRLSSHQKDRFQSLVKKLNSAERPFSVVFCGVFSSGKTSLINQLLNYSYKLPTGINPITKTVTRIRYGEELTCRYYNGTQAVELNAEETLEIVQGLKSVNGEIMITMPAEILKNGVEFIDTPGLDDETALEELTQVAVLQADMAVICCGALQFGKLTEQDLIESLDELFGNYCVVATRADNLNKREKQDILTRGPSMVADKGNAAGVFSESEQRFFIVNNSEEAGEVSCVRQYLKTILDDGESRQRISGITDKRMSVSLLEKAREAAKEAELALSEDLTALKAANDAVIRKLERTALLKQLAFNENVNRATPVIKTAVLKKAEDFRGKIANLNSPQTFKSSAIKAADSVLNELADCIVETSQTYSLGEAWVISNMLKATFQDNDELIPAPTGYYVQTRDLLGRAFNKLIAGGSRFDDGREWVWNDYHQPAVNAFQETIGAMLAQWRAYISRERDRIVRSSYPGGKEEEIEQLEAAVTSCKELQTTASSLCAELRKSGLSLRYTS